MSIPTAARPTPLGALQAGFQHIDPKTGLLTPSAQQTHESLRKYVNGSGRIVPCSETGTNVLALRVNDASPLIEGYIFGDCFLFWAENTSTGSVTAFVTLPDGTVLSTLKVYISSGASQAGSGNVVQNSVYVLFYAPHLDSNAGGFVLK